MVRFRFAPSPTGYLHVGNARIALLNWLFANALSGEFMLRMDDTDQARNDPVYEQAIYDDLKWLGLNWDCFARQSERQARYDAARDQLLANGRLYPCFEREEELALKRKTLLTRGLPPVYDRSALKLSQTEIDEKIAAGEQPHWRFKLSDEAIAFNDLARGEVYFNAGHLSDPVLIREDGRVLYSLSSVVDDGELEISHILRGEDHVTNTAVQVELFQALGFKVPNFIHLPLMLGGEGEKLSKRSESLSLRQLKADGIEPQALNTYLAGLGTNKTASEPVALDALIEHFDIKAFGRAAPRFDLQQVKLLNQHWLSIQPFATVKERLEPLGVNEALWLAVRKNIPSLEALPEWVEICFKDIALPPADDADYEYLKLAAECLPQEPWQAETVYHDWIAELKSRTDRKGKAFFMPLRLALTGLDHGPEMQAVLPLLGYMRAQKRLLQQQ